MKNQKVRTFRKTWQQTTAPQEVLEQQKNSSLEENLERMHKGESVDPHAPLASNAINEELRQKLLAIEVRALKHTGRLEEVLEKQELQQEISQLENRSTAQIIKRIKAKEKT